MLYCSVDPFALYFQEGHQLIRKFILAGMNEVVPPDARTLAAKKPLHVELMLTRQPECLIIHVLNYFAQKRIGTLVQNEELIPVRDIAIHVRTERSPKRALLVPEREEIRFETMDGWTTVRLSQLDLQAVIALEY